MSTIRFIHAADSHLDSPFKGMTELPMDQLTNLRASTFTAFERLIEHALQSIPDFVLIVGDIYDGENRSLRAQLKFQEGMEKLNAAAIPVVISYGNHDHLGGRWTRFDLPSNVHIFQEDVGEKQLNIRGQDVSIYGFSYKERHIREAMIEHFPMADNHDAIHIGMLHGSLAGDESHAVYAPFRKEELLAKHYNYWALGHIHLRQHLHEEPPIVYPGNLQGRHRNESGIKGFYEVELSNEGESLKFIPASALVFERITISCVGIRHANEWLEACVEALDSFRAERGAGIVELTMVDVDKETAFLFSQSTNEEWLEVLREVVGEGEPFIWVQMILLTPEREPGAVSGALQQTVLGVIDGWSEEEWKLLLNDVYQHARSVKYLDVLTEDDIQDVKNEAVSILIAEKLAME